MQSIMDYENNENITMEKSIIDYLPLVKRIAICIKRKLPSHIELEDLLQSGVVGLLEAQKNFNPDMGASFETFAGKRIRGAIIDALRKNSWANRDIIKNMKRIADATKMVEQREKRQASIEDITAALGVSADEHAKMAQEINLLYVTNLTDDYLDASLISEADDPAKLLEAHVAKDKLKEVLTTLPQREQLVLSLYYVEELTFKEIGEVMDLTEARICQLHSHAIAKLRTKIKVD